MINPFYWCVTILSICLAELMKDAPIAIPYPGAKERYILDIENHQLTKEIISILEPITPLPKPKKKK